MKIEWRTSKNNILYKIKTSLFDVINNLMNVQKRNYKPVIYYFSYILILLLKSEIIKLRNEI